MLVHGFRLFIFAAMLTIYPSQVPVQTLQHYLQSAVAPRPIALASTLNSNGDINLSPFSFFNIFGTNPPTLIFSPNRRIRDGSIKHTLENLQEVPEVVINMVHYGIVEQVSLASCEYEKGINEFTKSGLTPVPSEKISPPRVGESQAAFECAVTQIIHLGEKGGAANLVICEILVAHFSEDILGENNMIDQQKTDWVARLGADWYTRVNNTSLFEIPKPNIHKGIGVDQIPKHIRNNPLFDGNDLGRLGNIEKLPTKEEIFQFKAKHPQYNSIESAKQFLSQKMIVEAWMVLLSTNK